MYAISSFNIDLERISFTVIVYTEERFCVTKTEMSLVYIYLHIQLARLLINYHTGNPDI